jgi:hypothetical protein
MTDGTYVNALLTLIDALQTGLLQTLHALGLTDSVAGQPAWPFAWRVAGETLVIDRGLARQLGLTMAACVLAAVFVLAAVIARKRQVWPWAFVGTAALTLVIAPWPTLGVVLTDAVPTSFHRRSNAGWRSTAPTASPATVPMGGVKGRPPPRSRCGRPPCRPGCCGNAPKVNCCGVYCMA